MGKNLIMILMYRMYIFINKVYCLIDELSFRFMKIFSFKNKKVRKESSIILDAKDSPRVRELYVSFR